ncbi:MAG: hypothetical protein HUJ25_18415 [Crocinitomicaceae bacterium]|nr:hypothetical protein [Crocinitomicaceae bacterium]
MRKYKVNRKEPVKMPSKETIEKYKDFPRLRHEYDSYVKRPKKPLYKDKKMFWFILLILLLTYLIVQSVNDKKEEEESNTKSGQTIDGDKSD